MSLKVNDRHFYRRVVSFGVADGRLPASQYPQDTQEKTAQRSRQCEPAVRLPAPATGLTADAAPRGTYDLQGYACDVCTGTLFRGAVVAVSGEREQITLQPNDSVQDMTGFASKQYDIARPESIPSKRLQYNDIAFAAQ